MITGNAAKHSLLLWRHVPLLAITSQCHVTVGCSPAQPTQIGLRGFRMIDMFCHKYIINYIYHADIFVFVGACSWPFADMGICIEQTTQLQPLSSSK